MASIFTKIVKLLKGKPNYVIVCALKSEATYIAKGYNKHIVGVGPIVAAQSLTKYLMDNPHIKKVINMGGCGSTIVSPGNVIKIDRFVDLDADFTALGRIKYQHYDKCPALYDAKNIVSSVLGAGITTCGTSGGFVTKQIKGINFYDMEGAALAMVCYNFGVEFKSFKVVTDKLCGESWKVIDEKKKSYDALARCAMWEADK